MDDCAATWAQGLGVVSLLLLYGWLVVVVLLPIHSALSLALSLCMCSTYSYLCMYMCFRATAVSSSSVGPLFVFPLKRHINTQNNWNWKHLSIIKRWKCSFCCCCKLLWNFSLGVSVAKNQTVPLFTICFTCLQSKVYGMGWFQNVVVKDMVVYIHSVVMFGITVATRLSRMFIFQLLQDNQLRICLSVVHHWQNGRYVFWVFVNFGCCRFLQKLWKLRQSV